MQQYARGCCSAWCLYEISFANFIDKRETYAGMSQEEGWQWLVGFLRQSIEISANGEVVMDLKIDGRRLCPTAFRSLYGVSNNRFYQAADAGADGQAGLRIHGNVGNNNAGKKGETVMARMHAWLTKEFDKLGDQDITITGRIYVPGNITHQSLYVRFCKAMVDDHRVIQSSLPKVDCFNK